MNETSFSEMLRRLSNDYYENIIGFDEYRSKRKNILDKIDREINGRTVNAQQASDSSGSSRATNSNASFVKPDFDI
jgi:hypothetical protein